MGKERILEKTKEVRTSGFIRIGEIIPGIMRDVEKRIKESHKNKRVSPRAEAEKEAL